VACHSLALFDTACRTQVDAVAFLLSQRGIKTNLGTEANWTPLHVACDYPNADRRMKLMSLLLAQKGTNPNIQNSAGALIALFLPARVIVLL
jgi:ankyrin repeat protein